ncbi:MAG TPA: type II toxin-antitoxin system RelE/ParE family toxin [Thermomicrobiales bacterium]|nr:type II toxin-antitoxin system RelE/ParE family toxin [Thermomicrobiales bacterium]
MPPYTIRLTPAAARQLRSLPPQTRVRVVARIDALAVDPRPPGCEKLQGSERHHRVRSGDYRIIYRIDDAELIVSIVHMGHRRDVYRRFDG